MVGTYYKKVGRKYVPVSYYDSNLMDALPEGSHLTVVKTGGTVRRCKIDDALAPMIAAGIYAENAMCNVLLKASDLRPATKKQLTPEQAEAWLNFVTVMGGDIHSVEIPSVAECIRAGVNAMVEEANRRMQYEIVKQAYDNFLCVAKLTE